MVLAGPRRQRPPAGNVLGMLQALCHRLPRLAAALASCLPPDLACLL